MLLSENFLASQFSYEEELRRAFARSEEGQTRIVPILLRECDWKQSWFGELEALPTKARPLIEWENLQAGLNDVAARLGEVLVELSESQPVVDKELDIFDNEDLIEILQNIRRSLAVLKKSTVGIVEPSSTRLIEIDQLEQREKRYVVELKRRGVTLWCSAEL